ncbi:RluA family pseudouridine synthase [Blautia sp. OF03-15BH]|uniref:RluA family pseudouridine synthase n=1 Tax=Blautia sp. OF03-15BH TaxID=2292287 RepID=UPI000E4EE3D0|nr:RluA family pseudouridine synthase [Blautia sp. OF03-15BH]RGY02250.1 RluA family pseudouridine synthase [Blautia sp. OF03-15BH]
MERIFEYQISSGEEGRKLGDFLREKGYSRQLLRQLKETENGLLRNGQPTFMTIALKNGDRIRVRLLEKAEGSEAIMPAPLPFEIVYEDEDLLVINKPADMPIHPSFQNHGNTLADALTWHYQQQGKEFVYRCINRLDRDTTGLLIVARHQLSASILSDMVRKREIHREYLAIVEGIPPEKGTISAPIGRKEGSAILREVNFETGEPARTHFTRLETRNGLSLVSLKLETGRTHQIRVHMAYIGCPLIGDYLYYPDHTRINRQALHSYRLSFLHPITGKALSFTAPLPEDMERAFRS